jgi:integrase
MARTRTPGIRLDRKSGFIIDKEHRGMPIYARLGVSSQEHAERRLAKEIERIDALLEQKANGRRKFSDCAARYLSDSKDKRSLDAIAWHIRLLIPYLGSLDIHQVHDGTLQSFIADRIASNVTATTINRSLEVVRTILTRAARAYRHDDGRPWLEGLPPLITMLPETRRPPYPITWEEQDRLFSKLPARLARMVLFAVNTGARESNVCGLEWAWEVPVPEIGRSVFVISPEAFKSKRAHVVILNDIAWSIVEAQRGQHPIWVFPYRGKAVATMNNTAWQRARREEGCRACASTIFVTPSAAACVPPVYPSKTERCYSATPIIRWQATTRVQMSVACSSRQTSCSIAKRCARSYASPMPTPCG